MSYNADGLRVRKYDSGGWKNFVWDLQNILLETNTLGVTQGRYTLQPDVFGNLLSQRRGATSHFFHFDALGSTAGLSTTAQTLSDSYRYKAYGELLTQSGSTQNPFRWVGRQGYFYDPDLLQYYIRARHYDPVLGRWLSVDPIGFGIRGTYISNTPSLYTRREYDLETGLYHYRERYYHAAKRAKRGTATCFGVQI